jgi:hypothetical protein
MAYAELLRGTGHAIIFCAKGRCCDQTHGISLQKMPHGYLPDSWQSMYDCLLALLLL